MFYKVNESNCSVKMLVSAIADFFRLKVVGNIIILTCSWCAIDRVKFTRHLSQYGIRSTISCDPGTLGSVVNHRFQGVLYFTQKNNSILEKTKRDYFSHWYKWLVVGEDLPEFIHNVRYDADIAYLKANETTMRRNGLAEETLYFDDVFVHPREGFSLHPWAYWTEAAGLRVTHGSFRISRRLNLNQYPLKIAAPTGHFSPNSYNGSFTEYLRESADPQRDSAIRCAYTASSLIIDTLNASEVLVETNAWSSLTGNTSMLRMVELGVADMTGAPLRVLPLRIAVLDYILPIWPFNVGFTYLAERESSSNMYVEPFSPGVWWTCLGIGVVLAVSQRITARKPEEKEGAFIGVLATWLQQDASAVPEGVSGRWSFMVMSTSAMLVHAYYTSAIVSALMSTGRGGPDSLRALADSKYAIASDDFDYMRYLFWDVETNWTDLEYLKKKKMTSKLYQDMKKGIELIGGGSTAYHTEYNQIYPYFKSFSDDQLCKLQYLDTIAEQPIWTTATKRSQFTDVFRSKGAWVHETGLAYRTVSRLRMRQPPCRAALLAERVKFADVAPLLILTVLGGILSFIVLGIELFYVKLRRENDNIYKRNSKRLDEAEMSDEDEDYDYVD